MRQYIFEKLSGITFANETKILIFTILGGTILIGFLMFISIFALKYDFEMLFANHTRPLVKLEEIKDIYQVNIGKTLQSIDKQDIDQKDIIEMLTLARQLVLKQWNDYKAESNSQTGGLPEFASNWLRFFIGSYSPTGIDPYESKLIDNIENKIDNINNKLKRLILLISNNDIDHTGELINNLSLETNSINIYLSSLITNNLKRAIATKEANDRLFNTSTYMLILLIGLAFSFVTLVSLTIINHFKQLHYSLEENIARKTKELIDLNRSLESRIKKEVEASRKKDNIMFHQARLASMGEVLQNIAHQWRQPLSSLMMIIQGFQSKFMMDKLDEKFINHSVQEALKIGGNMSETLDDFKNFFAPNKAKQSFDIRRAVQKAIELSKYQLQKEQIDLIFDAKESIKTYGFKNELIHVVLNIINNAKDALANRSDVDTKKILIILKRHKKYAVISIIDNGGGIDENILPKVFDPYFTTKHKSIGTGIGLYMSKQMVEKHMDGKISCKNIRYRFDKTKKFYDCAIFAVEIPLVNDPVAKKGV